MLLPSKEADEIKHNCVEEFYVNQLETEAKECAKSGILAKVEDLGMPISTLTADIDQFKTGIGESQVQMKRDGQDWEKQNQEFQMTVADSQISDEFSESSLAKARNALNELDEKLGSSWMTSSSSARGSRI